MKPEEANRCDKNSENDYLETVEFTSGRSLATAPPGEEIVISGISGGFPDSYDVYHFRDNLYNKVDMVSSDERRWKNIYPEVPHRTGKICDIEKFDAGFFGVHYRQVMAMDPISRVILERAVEALLDAGINPSEVEGTNTGVYVATCFSESEKTWFFDVPQSQYFAITGNLRSMIANRVSFHLKLAGPSHVIDTACSSSLYALNHAYKAMRAGEIDMAIVGGGNLVLHPMVSRQFLRLGVLSKDGACKVFDQRGDGYARSETIACVILQKAKDCRRNYSQIIHAKTNQDGYKPQSITYPSGEAQRNLLQEFYQECGVEAASLSFLEAHGTGTFVGDPEEVQAIDEVFCKKRTTPLLVGSVKSNIGHTEPSSGLCSVTKAIIGFENGFIPPNLHYEQPREGVEALEKGRLKVVTEKMPFQDDRGLIGVNSFGFGGANAHVLLRWNKKTKIDKGLPKDGLPRLVCVSGRPEHGLDTILNDLSGRILDVEYVRLYHQIFSKNISGHFYRGYSILAKSGELKRSSRFCEEKKSLCLVFTNFGTSWSKIANQLFVLPLFAASIQRIHNILLPKGVNVTEIVINGGQSDKSTKFNEIMGSMTLQIAIVDIFKILEFRPDNYLGLGFGELICDYLEGSATLEETVRSVYFAALDKSKILQIGKPKVGNSKRLSSVSDLKKGSVIVEVGNRGLDVPKNYCELLPFNKIGNFVNFLEILGNLYQFGHNFYIDRLYPKVQYPVSRGTPMISPLIRWNHSANWFVTSHQEFSVTKTQEKSTSLTLIDIEWSYLNGHMIDGRALFPASGYLRLVWEAFIAINGHKADTMKIVMENCKFLRATTVPKESKIEFNVIIQRASGNFEILENDTIVATGKIKMFKKGVKEQIDLPLPVGVKPEEVLPLRTKDIYKELRLRGYNYKNSFKRIIECDGSVSKGLISWDSNWITFLDNIFQLKILQNDTRGLFVPTGIKKITIDGEMHTNYVQTFGDDQKIPVYLYKNIDVIKCGGVEIHGVNVNSIARRKPLGLPVLEKYEFIPNEAELTIQDSVRVMMQLILENLPGYKVKTIEVIDDDTNENYELLSPIIHNVLGDLPLIQPSVSILTTNEITVPNVTVENKKLIAETDCTLVIGSNLLQRLVVLNQAFGAAKENAFVLSRESINFESKATNLSGIDILTIHTVGTEKMYLIRKTTSFESTSVIDISDTNEEFSWLPGLQKAIATDPRTIVVARNKPLSGILGLVNCIRREPGCSNVRTVFTFDGAPAFDLHDPFYSTQLKKNLSVNVYKNSKWGTYRHLLLDDTINVEREHLFCNTLVRGDLSSLKWLEGPLSHDAVLPPEKDLVHVYYSSLNFRDIMTASGRISADIIVRDRTQQEFIHGFEYAGKTKDGRRVMGIVSGALSTLLAADRYLVWPCPDHMSLEEAATIPVVYSTVYCSFFMVCNVKQGQSILIHAGSGGVGQAAISVALHHGLTVYTTAGTKEKREFLKKRFPQLNDNHIGNSRDTSFEQMIFAQTNGRGVDYVLNSLAEEKLLASVRCLAPGGNFIEIGKFDLASDNPLRLKLLEKGATFHGVMVDAVFSLDPKGKRTMKRLITEGIQNGAIKPLVRTIFEMEQIEQAFRYMAAGKHIGKVLIQIRKEENDRHALVTRKTFLGMPRFSCNPDHVTVIIGGLGGFGLELADWLVLRGMRNLVLTSRKGVTTGYQSFRIKTWTSYGVRVHISTSDVTTKQGCQQLIEEAASYGPIESIFNLAVVLKDGLLENQTVDNFRQSLEPKAFATTHLDEITRRLCPNLRDFVIFSSVSCGRGNPGQTNYGMANSIMERICEKRQEDGYPALAIEWGAIGDVGLVAELQEEHTEMEIGGTLQQRISNCLQVLDTLLAQKNAIVSSMVVAEKRRGVGVADNIVDAVAHILGLGDLKTVSLHASLSELGMDSMTAVEIKQTLEREYEVFLTPHDIRNMTFARLQEIQEERVLEDDSTKKNRALGGFEMLLRLMTDAKTSKIPLLRLPTRVKDNTSAPNFIFFPGIEGVSKVLAPLAANLNAHVHCLQFIYANQRDSITEMAETLLPLVENLISKTKPFNILAYSFGVVVAMEVVSMLEARGYVGTIFAIDGAPEMLQKHLKDNLSVQSEAVFQTGFIMQIMSLYLTMDMVSKYREKLFKCTSFEERLKVAEDAAPKDIHSIEYLREFTIASFARLKALINYEITYPKIKSNVKLFKPSSTTTSGIDEDYKLSRICENPVDVRMFNGNHVTVLENVEMAEVINSSLSVSTQFIKETLLSDEAGRMTLGEVKIKQI